MSPKELEDILPDLQKIVRQVCDRADLYGDLLNEVSLILLETDISRVHTSKTGFIYGMVYNQYYKPGSQFNVKYKRYEQFDELPYGLTEDIEEQDITLDEILSGLEAIDRLWIKTWRDKKGSYLQMQREINRVITPMGIAPISRQHISKRLKEIFNKIRKQWSGYML